ncbi:hypothetical protein GCM10017674_35290 [Streptomyces gardneri]|uniref:Uncharacterized protein n=1 Tax=Streptomyces gardneri TaxID=66892 RepID=A0A4Y3RM42_9ACTN|nr:hypothetical protein SGA01_33980 [Streptomyces gardneri]GHH00225.1 hypothetical protein GCM10017674_35290 [Streptomyces gardneri]
MSPGTFIDRSAWHHADGWRLYGVSPLRSNTIRRTRPDVSATEHLSVKGAQACIRTFQGCAKRLKGYVRGELLGPPTGPDAQPAGPCRTRSGRVCGIDGTG